MTRWSSLTNPPLPAIHQEPANRVRGPSHRTVSLVLLQRLPQGRLRIGLRREASDLDLPSRLTPYRRQIQSIRPRPGFLGARTDPLTITKGYCPRLSTELGGHSVDIQNRRLSDYASELRLYGRAGGTRTHDLLTPRRPGTMSARVAQCRELRFCTEACPYGAAKSAQYRLLREHKENISLCVLSLLTFRLCTDDRGGDSRPLDPVEEVVDSAGPHGAAPPMAASA